MGLPTWLSDKEYACQCRRCKRHRFDPWVGQILGGNGNPLQYSCLDNFTDRGAWRSVVHGGLKELNTTEQLSMHSHTYSCSPKDLVSMWPVAILYYLPSQLGFRKESSWEFLWRLSLALRNRGLFLVLGYQLYLTVFSPERETGVPVRDNLPTYFKNIKWCSTSCSSNRGLTKKK